MSGSHWRSTNCWAWGSVGAGPDEMVSRSTVKAQPRCHPTSTFLTRETGCVHLHGFWYWEPWAGEAGWRAGIGGMASRQTLGDSVGFLHEAFQSNGVVKYRHLGADIGIQPLPIHADESRFVPTTKWPASVRNCSVYS